MSTNLFQASKQWSSRPADERFLSLTDLLAHCEHQRKISHAKVVANRDVKVLPLAALAPEEDPEHKGLIVQGAKGVPVAMTNWSASQLSQRAGAPFGYLRTLPAELAADCLNYGLQCRDVEELGLLARVNGIAELAAVTGPNYGRIWNVDVVRALVQRFGDGVTGDFRVPGEFGEPAPITKANTTIYGSDRDVWVFLADEEHRIELPNRRDGESGSLARGIFCWNSEVGSSTLGMATFLYDYVCCNRIVWGATEYKEVRIRHTAGAPHRWIEEAMPAIRAFANAPAAPVQALLQAARQRKVTKLDEFLSSRFTRAQAVGIKAVHQDEEHHPMENLWDVATGITAYARGIQNQDERVKLERVAGDVLNLAR